VPDGPLTPGGLRVCSHMCETCVFRPGNLMLLRSGRLSGMVRGMVRGAIREDSFIPCHKTLDGERAVCHGFYDRFADRTLGCRFGTVIGVIWLDPDTPHPGDAPGRNPG
jgi:hypothetical protein